MFMKQDRLLKDAMKELADSLDASRIEPLHSGIGIGKLRPIQAPWTPVMAAEPRVAMPMNGTPSHHAQSQQFPTANHSQQRATPQPHKQQPPQAVAQAMQRPTPPQPRLSISPQSMAVPPSNRFATLAMQERGWFAKMFSIGVGHCIDLVVIACTLLVGMLALQVLFNDQHPFSGRAAMTQSMWLTIRDIGWPMVAGTIYGLFVAYWLFFKILAGHTIGQFVLAPSRAQK